MLGVTLSRWTMSYFAVALLSLLAGELALTLGYGYPLPVLNSPATLAVVHVLTLGWLSLLLAGALQQFVPVLVARPLAHPRLSLPILLLLIIGTAGLITGFHALSTGAGGAWFALAACALSAGFLLLLWNLLHTLWRARPWALPARFVLAGLTGLTLAVLLGLSFLGVLAGATGAPWTVALLGYGVPLHVIAALGGWLTLTAIGVSYRLLAMFMLAPEPDRRGSHASLWLSTAALLLAVIGGTTLVVAGLDAHKLLVIAGMLGVPALLLYLRDMRALYRRRQRRVLELNASMSVGALLSLAAGATLLLLAAVGGNWHAWLPAIVYLLLFGWLSGLGLAQLYKIVAFLTWLEVFGPQLGRGPTPRVQDLVDEPHARGWFRLYFLTAWLAATALLLDWPAAFRMAAATQLLATLAIVDQLWRTRRLCALRQHPLPVRPALLCVRQTPATPTENHP